MTGLELKEMRESWNYKQPMMADYLGVNLRTYQDWEQGRFPVPELAESLLTVIDKMAAVVKHFESVKENPSKDMLDEHTKLMSRFFKPANVRKPRKQCR